MKRLIRNRKGMSLVEVMIALAILGLLSVPIMMAFMNTQIYARKIDKQNEINSITRTVTQIVSDGFKNDAVITDIGGLNIELDGDPLTLTDTFTDIIRKAKNDATKKDTVSDLPIMENGVKSLKYKYSITFDYNNFRNPLYEGVYNFLIIINEYDSGNVVNKLKIAVDIGKVI
ncbi:type II secretion system protein [Acetivibrio cellulolyticus]|uniref:type II secretion system protein n=1 Tax=Acetivibrio cellulolyticus TaxID=35830 RepID=UPI0001E2C6F2|nr:type II secretion system protein [Acetivibrio cellulolyticus]